MTVYVDPIVVYPPERCRGLPGREWCHMMTDDPTLAELHAMARMIGMRRSWFQSHDPDHPHYDLTLSRREAAIRCGAVSVSSGRVMLILAWPTGARWRERLSQSEAGREMLRRALAEVQP